MDSIFRMPRSFSRHLLYVLLVPAFFICFCSLYNPFSIKEFYEVGGKSFFFHFLMLSCIMLAVLAITRLILSVLSKVVNFRRWHYVLWCVGEIVIISFFMAMYTSLFYGDELPYFLALPQCLKFAGLVLLYPYAVMLLVREIDNLSAAMLARQQAAENSLAKFYDDSRRLRLTIDPSALLYISADGNYVKINYAENGKVREYLLRNSMKSLEELAARHGLVRCHRSYYINPKHVKLLSRKKDVITAEMKEEGVRPIPVSQQYYNVLAELL